MKQPLPVVELFKRSVILFKDNIPTAIAIMVVWALNIIVAQSLFPQMNANDFDINTFFSQGTVQEWTITIAINMLLLFVCASAFVLLYSKYHHINVSFRETMFKVGSGFLRYLALYILLATVYFSGNVMLSTIHRWAIENMAEATYLFFYFTVKTVTIMAVMYLWLGVIFSDIYIVIKRYSLLNAIFSSWQKMKFNRRKSVYVLLMIFAAILLITFLFGVVEGIFLIQSAPLWISDTLQTQQLPVKWLIESMLMAITIVGFFSGIVVLEDEFSK